MKKLFPILFLCLISAGTLNAQEMLNSFGLGITASTNGVGGELYWLPTSKWKVSVNGEYMPPINIKGQVPIDEANVNLEGKYKTGGVFLTGGYQILNWLYVTAGAGINFFNPSASGEAESFEFGDVTLSPETVGEIDINIKGGAKVSPYLAIGFGKQAAVKKRVGFGVEIGTYYMGAPKLDIFATGMLEPNMDPEHIQSLEAQISQFRFYPMLKLNLTIKIF